jgi:hypothetical protein
MREARIRFNGNDRKIPVFYPARKTAPVDAISRSTTPSPKKNKPSIMDSRFPVDLTDPLGICAFEIIPGLDIRPCNNVRHSKGMKRITNIGIVIIMLFLADGMDILAWLLGWIPVIGDILGNVILGNIIDGAAIVILFVMVGPIALLGLPEFIDILGIIPALGDIVALIEIIPTWTIMGFVYMFLYIVSKPSKAILASFP